MVPCIRTLEATGAHVPIHASMTKLVVPCPGLFVAQHLRFNATINRKQHPSMLESRRN
jgi:hypothetical protein